jgi:glucose-1-phosphate cytidylyltransferase
MLTYGDGVADVNINTLLTYHKETGKIVTITAVQPGGRFGTLDIDETGAINSFREKNVEDGGWINGGFMVLQPEIFNYLDDDSTIFERNPLETLASQGQLSAYKHNGFWQCMDTQRDKLYLEELLASDNAPWRLWK